MPELEDKVIGLIEESYSERQIAQMDGMPTAMTIRRWKDEDKDFVLVPCASELSAELFDDKRRDAAKWLMEQASNRSASGEDFPKGVVEAVKAVMQEHARSAALRDDSRLGDRKTVKVDATEDAKGYARMLEAQKGDGDA